MNDVITQRSGTEERVTSTNRDIREWPRVVAAQVFSGGGEQQGITKDQFLDALKKVSRRRKPDQASS